MIALVEGAERRKTPNEIALNILLAGLTLIFLVVVVTLRPFAEFAATDASVATLIALLVALIPTTIGALLSAIGIAGMDRLVRRNVLALSGRAVEASGDVDVLLLDKTGTITLGNRQATAVHPDAGRQRGRAGRGRAARLARRRDARGPLDRRAREGVRDPRARARRPTRRRSSRSRAETRMSGVDLNGRRLRKGAGDAIAAWVEAEGGRAPAELRAGARPGRAARAAPRSPSPATARSSGSSTSRTSSRRGCASASTSCGRWGSGP